MSDWYTISCEDCGADVYARHEWDRAPRFCRSCRAERDAQWYDEICSECGGRMRICRDWEHVPTRCRDCRDAIAAKWRDATCEDCGSKMRICTDWDRIPRICTSCKSARSARWSDQSCAHCGHSIRVCLDWKRIPKYCRDCRDAYPAYDEDCAHCGETFTIWTGTRIRCEEKGWDLPKRCPNCRKVLHQSPFYTTRLGGSDENPIYRTLNSRGQVVAESRGYTSWTGKRHHDHWSARGRKIALTWQATDSSGRPIRKTAEPDGAPLATSRSRRSGGLVTTLTRSGTKLVTRSIDNRASRRWWRTE